MRVRIIQNGAGYSIQVKRYWLSFWKTVRFSGNASSAIEIANDILKKKTSGTNTCTHNTPEHEPMNIWETKIEKTTIVKPSNNERKGRNKK